MAAPGQMKVDASTLALWRMDDAAGSTACVDDSPNAGHLSWNTAPTTVAGEIGTAKKPSATQRADRVLTPAEVAAVQGEFTVECLVNVQSSAVSWRGLLGVGDGSTSLLGVFLHLDWLYIEARPSGLPSAYTPKESAVRLPTGTWVHVALVKVWTGTNCRFQLYVNGVRTDDFDFGATNYLQGATGLRFEIGRSTSTYPLNPAGAPNTLVDEIKFHNKALTAEEVTAAYDAIYAPAPSAPVITSPEEASSFLSDEEILVEGTGEADASVEVFVDGASAATGTADSAGVFSISIGTLGAGTYSITCVQTNAFGTSVETSPVSIVVVEAVSEEPPPSSTPPSDPEPPPLSGGGSSPSSISLLRAHLSPALKGRGWDALIEAIASGDKYNQQLAESAFDQLFKSTASGVYLDRRAADDGFSRQSGIGIDDEVFRKLAIKTTARKQIAQVMLEALEAYYGSEATRANITSSTAAPYSMQENDTLLIQIDNLKTVTVTFETDDFALPSAATTAEVVAAITRTFRANNLAAYATEFKDPTTGLSYVRIFSGSLGLNGGVTIRGGRAQNALLFPTKVHATGGPDVGTQFTIVVGTGINGVEAGRVRLTYSAGPNPSLQEVRTGDYATVYGSVFDETVQGTYIILASAPTYVEFEDSGLEWAASVALVQATDIQFYRPTKSTIQSATRMATVTQGDPSTLDVILPATTQAITRSANTGAYLHSGAALSIDAIARDSSGLVTVTTAEAHGLINDQLVTVDNVAVSSSAFVPNFTDIASDHEVLSRKYFGSTKLQDGRILFGGGSDLGGVETFSNAVGIFDPSTNTITSAASMSVPRAYNTFVTLKSGRVLCVGGHLSAEVYDPETDTWTATGAPSEYREVATATLLDDGRVLVVGGTATSAIPELYNPVTNSWSSAAACAVARDEIHSAVKLYDGRVLVAGGGLVTTEVYNPITNVWTTAGNLASAPLGGAAVLLPVGSSGLVMLCGGDDLADVYLFNPATMMWSVGPSMNYGRMWHAITPLKDGRVLVADGTWEGDPAPAEIYDPFERRWITHVAPTIEANGRRAHLLDDGRVLFIDGSANSFLATLEPSIYSTFVDVVGAGGLNGTHRVTVLDATSFTFSTPNFPYVTSGSGGTATALRAITNAISGPFIYDLDWEPDHPESVGSFYVTGAAAGRVAAAKTIDDLVAAGVRVRKTVVYPGDAGLGNAGASGPHKVSDKVVVWGGDEPDAEVEDARGDS